MRVSEIRVKRIRVNQGLGVYQLEKGKYFQFELGNWEMAEEQEQEDENKRIKPRERARGQKKGPPGGLVFLAKKYDFFMKKLKSYKIL